MLITNLVRVYTADGIKLSGLFSPGETDKPAVILVHGFTADFYTREFQTELQSEFSKSGFASVSVQTRGSGVYTEFDKLGEDDTVLIGSYFELLEEAHLDISAWIKFLMERGHKSVVLVGHSLGTIKTVRYLFEGEYKDLVEKVILLAPFDKNGYLQRKSGDSWHKHVKVAADIVKSGRGREIIPDTYDDYAMSYQTFYSWYKEDDLGRMFDFYLGEGYEFPALSRIKIPVQIVVGDKDDFFYISEFSTLEQVKGLLKKHITQLDLQLVAGCGHNYEGFEARVAGIVVSSLVNIQL